MPITINKTLPKEWKDNVTYEKGDLVSYAYIIYKCQQTSLNNRPDISKEYWKPLDIYIKDATVMDHGQYSGDEEFWQRDQIYIDSNGFVYLNNENTGINVRGPEGHLSLDFESLTPEQIEQLRGPQGVQGPEGPQGIQGPEGPMGQVALTPEQVAALKGDDGKSTYQIWLEQGYTGTEADFLNWIRKEAVKLDTELSRTSKNGIENQAITKAFQDYKNNISEEVRLLAARVEELENRLNYTNNGTDYQFRFGVTNEGKYGYILTGTETIIPFDNSNTDVLMSGGVPVTASMFNINEAENGYTKMTTHHPDTDDITIVSNQPEILTFDEMFDAYVYIYKDGIIYNADYDLGLYSMNFDYQNPTTPTNLTSKGLEVGEGVIFNPLNVSNTAIHFSIVVEPINTGDTINYQIGKFTDEAAELPSLITTGAYRTGYTNGSLTERTTIRYTLRPNEGLYFGSTSICEYKIIEIYVD